MKLLSPCKYSLYWLNKRITFSNGDSEFVAHWTQAHQAAQTLSPQCYRWTPSPPHTTPKTTCLSPKTFHVGVRISKDTFVGEGRERGRKDRVGVGHSAEKGGLHVNLHACTDYVAF